MEINFLLKPSGVTILKRMNLGLVDAALIQSVDGTVIFIMHGMDDRAYMKQQCTIHKDHIERCDILVTCCSTYLPKEYLWKVPFELRSNSRVKIQVKSGFLVVQSPMYNYY